MKKNERRWFLAGLFLTTLVALAAEMLDTRLLSVLTWYHLSFFAVSVAMFGMSAGAVYVYQGGSRFTEERARTSLSKYSLLFTLSLPASHIANICIPLRTTLPMTTVAALVFSTLVLSIPFFLAGVVVTIALTRVPGRIGLFYAVDLIGAALGALAVIPLLELTDITSAVFALAGLGFLGTLCFRRLSPSPHTTKLLGLAAILFACAFLNNRYPDYGFRLPFTKGKRIDWHKVEKESWNVHSQIIAYSKQKGKPFYWGAGSKAENLKATTVKMQIDGAAGSFMTEWDGSQEALSWVKYDVTSLPYHLRKHGDTAIIGIGGGRDILTAIWGESSSVTAVEINQAFIDLLEETFRDFANIASREDVTLVHDEARSYLTRQKGRFDLIQMSLIDTWAATGAGAFTLTENGLYTLEAWKVFLDALKPGGLFAVTRWFTPEEFHETGRLLALATASLHERGIVEPEKHMALVACQAVATLIVSDRPLTEADLKGIETTTKEYDFRVLIGPGSEPVTPFLGGIVSATSRDELNRIIADQPFDYSPPNDLRPYFFNSLKPATLFRLGIKESLGVIARGNMMATGTLLLLGLIALVLVSLIILRPLVVSGLPSMDRLSFVSSLLYFAAIGMGFMMVQIAFMQRFSIYLGHPTYAVAIILFSMILFAGIGSLVSDRINVEGKPTWLVALPAAVASLLIGTVFGLQTLMDSTLEFGLIPRCATVLLITAPISLLLGLFFPIGMRLVGRVSQDATAWMWGINGACGVLAAVLAVVISMWAGIHISLIVAAGLYLSLTISSRVLWRKGAA